MSESIAGNIAPYRRLEQDQDAAAAYEKAIAIKPDDFRAYLNMGLAHESIKQYTPAIAAFKKYLTLKPEGSFADMARKKIKELSKKLSEK